MSFHCATLMSKIVLVQVPAIAVNVVTKVVETHADELRDVSEIAPRLVLGSPCEPRPCRVGGHQTRRTTVNTIRIDRSRPLRRRRALCEPLLQEGRLGPTGGTSRTTELVVRAVLATSSSLTSSLTRRPRMHTIWQ